MNRLYDKKHHKFAVLLNANSYFKYTKTSLGKNGHAADFFQILILSMTVLTMTGSEYEHTKYEYTLNLLVSLLLVSS